MVRHINKWEHSGLPVVDYFKWDLPIPVLDSHNHRDLCLESFLQMIYYNLFVKTL